MKPFDFAFPELNAAALLPLAILAITGILALIIEMISPKRDNNLIVGISIFGLFATAVSIFTQIGNPAYTTGAGMIISDSFGSALQLIVVVATSITVLFSESYLREKRIPFGEFYPLLLWSATGALIMCVTTNLLMLFIGLEILSVALYVLAGLSRSEEKSEESALKYFLLGAFASGFLLYGIALLYGATGSLQIENVRLAWVQNAEGSRILIGFGLGLMLIGLSFKASFVPFHQWTPDVYQGAPTNVTAFMASVSKVAAVAALWRVLSETSNVQAIWMPALTVLAVLTMTVGNLVALVQKDVKRTLGYSSISHAGYILVGVLAGIKNHSLNGSATIPYYLLSYSIMTIGAFAIVSLVAKRGSENTRFESLHGLWKKSPFLAVLLIIFVASLLGMPPTSGFLAKFYIFQDAVRADMGWLALVLALNSAISVYYYLGIAYAATVPDTEDAPLAIVTPSVSVKVACALCAVIVIGIGLFVSPLMDSLNLPNQNVGGFETSAMK